MPIQKHSLSPHQFRRKHAPLRAPLAILNLLIHLSPLLHDQIQHIIRVVRLDIGRRHELVDDFAEQGDIAAGVFQDVVEEGVVVVELSCQL